MRVLITDGNERVALAVARSLTRAGHAVVVTAPTRLSLAGVSRGICSRPVRADPLGEPAPYAAELGRVAGDEAVDIVLPMTDASVDAVLDYRANLPLDITIPVPERDTYGLAVDKARLLPLAKASGFGIPETRIIPSREESEAALTDAAFFPAIVKSHRSVINDCGTRRKTQVTQVADAAACRRVLAALPRAAFPVLLQRPVAGVGEGFFALRWNGRMVAMFAHRRLREKPPAGGVSVYRESIGLDDSLMGPGIRLLDALGWQGVAMVECRRDQATGRPVVMEVNGRFWGSLQLAIDCGVDFPDLLVRCAAGEVVPASRHYRLGVRSRWFWGDVDHLYLRLRDAQLRRASRLRAVVDFLRVRPGRDRSEVARWRDPAPFFIETLQWLRILRHGT